MKGHAFQVPRRTLECINIRRLGHLWTDQTPCSVPGSSLAHGAGPHNDAQSVRCCPAIAGKLQNLENIGDERFSRGDKAGLGIQSKTSKAGAKCQGGS